jgi:hypothetical protein
MTVTRTISASRQALTVKPVALSQYTLLHKHISSVNFFLSVSTVLLYM